jgi:hypothetical protein
VDGGRAARQSQQWFRKNKTFRHGFARMITDKAKRKGVRHFSRSLREVEFYL